MPLKAAYSNDIFPSYASNCEYYLIIALHSALTSSTAGFPLLPARASEHGKTCTAYSKPSLLLHLLVSAELASVKLLTLH